MAAMNRLLVERFRRWMPATAFLLCICGCGGGNSGPTPPPEPTPAPLPPPSAVLTQLSADQFTNMGSQHATEVEPGMFAYGSTLGTAFQAGRIFSGGAAAIGFSTSSDLGKTWRNGLVPNITQFQSGIYAAVSDPAVAFDAKHGVWLVSSLAIGSGTDTVIVNRSVDGHAWGSPIAISST